MTTDNKANKDQRAKPKQTEYTTYKWQEEQLMKSVTSVVHSAKFSIHEVSLEDGDKIYLVPRDFYEQAKIAIKNSNQDKE
tara:strand:- start:748 stop:987 length:240 start_codon:yes stop_codon:yes gene_type:complete